MFRSGKRFVVFAVFCLTMAMMVSGASAGTLTGATGLITLASADTLPSGNAEFGVRMNGGQVGATAIYGLMEELEVGVNSFKPNAQPLGVGLVLKGQLLNETESVPAVAVGFETDQSYLVASKRLTPRVRVHAGYLHGDQQGVAAGVAYTLNTTSVSSTPVSSPATTLLAEYVPSGVNVGARMFFGPSIAVDVALMDLEEFTGGVSFRLAF